VEYKYFMAEDVKKQIEQLREQIRRHDYLYYALNKPEITDQQYDKLFADLKKLEQAHPELITPDSPTQRVSEMPIEGFKRILGLSSTSLKQIITRLPLLIAVCGFAPYLFVKAIEIMNKMTKIILSIGTSILGTSTYLPEGWEFNLAGDVFEVIGLSLFILLYIALLIPMMLNHGRRWFSMIALGVFGYTVIKRRGKHASKTSNLHDF